MERAHVEAAAQAIGQPTKVFDAHTEDDIDRAVAAIVQQHIGALCVIADPF
jgi:DNA integrity scanning protein DisA with diadenylate cyclase activity